MNSIQLDRASSVPLYRQIVDAISDDVRSGRLAAGSKLPPTRDLVRLLSVNRSTAVAAYRHLEEKGLVRSRVGSGTVVVGPAAAAAGGGEPDNFSAAAGGPLAHLLRELGDADELADQESPERGGDFSRLAPDPTLFPVDPLRRALDEVLASEGAELLQYGNSSGHPGLRETLAARMEKLGVPARAEQILVVSGAQQGLDLILRAAAGPGERVAVEAPTYSGVLPLLRLSRFETVAIPLTPTGADLGELDRETAKFPIRLFYTMPTFHNPTGISTDRDHRRRLLRLARQRGFLLIEDGFEDDLRFAGESSPPLAALDPEAPVLYIGTFSKGLFPGIRLGWVFGDAATIRRLGALKRAVDYGAPPLLQAAVDRLCRSGAYDRHLGELRTAYAARRKALARAVSRHLPAECSVALPDGGFAVWIELPASVSSEQVTREVAREGIAVTPASSFFPPGSTPTNSLRLSISRVTPAEIDRGIRLLGRVIERRASRAGARRPVADGVPTL